MTTFRWVSGDLASGIQVRQVYGFCFDKSGRVLLRDDHGAFGLPGGRPEPGEDAVATLVRECLEESQITITDTVQIGYQEVTDDDAPPYAQLRFVATITEYLPRAADPDTGRTYGRLLTPINKAPALLDWGVDGLLQAADAAKAAMNVYGISLGTDRTDTYID